MKKVVLAVVAVLVIAGVVVALTQSSNDNSNSSANKTKPAPALSNRDKPATTQVSATILYTGNGFTPSTTTVKAGSTVMIKNASSSPLQFDSDPHPQHTDDPELNVGIVDAGSSATFKVTTTGNHGFHNHLNPSDTGTLVVE
jgi:plastocyanin